MPARVKIENSLFDKITKATGAKIARRIEKVKPKFYSIMSQAIQKSFHSTTLYKALSGKYRGMGEDLQAEFGLTRGASEKAVSTLDILISKAVNDTKVKIEQISGAGSANQAILSISIDKINKKVINEGISDNAAFITRSEHGTVFWGKVLLSPSLDPSRYIRGDNKYKIGDFGINYLKGIESSRSGRAIMMHTGNVITPYRTPTIIRPERQGSNSIIDDIVSPVVLYRIERAIADAIKKAVKD